MKSGAQQTHLSLTAISELISLQELLNQGFFFSMRNRHIYCHVLREFDCVISEKIARENSENRYFRTWAFFKDGILSNNYRSEKLSGEEHSP